MIRENAPDRGSRSLTEISVGLAAPAMTPPTRESTATTLGNDNNVAIVVEPDTMVGNVTQGSKTIGVTPTAPKVVALSVVPQLKIVALLCVEARGATVAAVIGCVTTVPLVVRERPETGAQPLIPKRRVSSVGSQRAPPLMHTFS